MDNCSHRLVVPFIFFVDYDALRALDSDNAPAAPSMSEEEINALPVHKYKVQSYHTAPSGPQR